VIEQLLFASKQVGSQKSAAGGLSMSSSSTLFASLCSNDLMATELVELLLSLQSASELYVGLETKVFARLLFNLPLWLGGTPTGAALHLAFLPALSFLAKSNPEKVRECLGIKEMIQLLRDLAFVKESDAHTEESIFGVGIVVCGHTIGTTALQE
jgi:hypothetical protein